MAFEVRTTELTIKLTAGSVSAIQRALLAVESALGDALITDGFTSTLKIKTSEDLSAEMSLIEHIFAERRGVEAQVSHKVTVDITDNPSKPHWNQPAFNLRQN